MSAPEVAAPARRRSNVWTPERLQLARSLWDQGVLIRDIRARVNQLPGKPLASDEAFQMKRSQLGWPSRRGTQGHAMPLPSPPEGEPCTFCGGDPGPGAVSDEHGEPACGPCGAAEIETQREEGFLPAVPARLPIVNCVTGDRAEAEALLRQGMSGRAVAEGLGLPLGDVARWVGELRDRGEIP